MTTVSEPVWYPILAWHSVSFPTIKRVDLDFIASVLDLCLGTKAFLSLQLIFLYLPKGEGERLSKLNKKKILKLNQCHTPVVLFTLNF